MKKPVGEMEGGAGRVEEAVPAYRAALQERTRGREPLTWASTESILGNLLQTLADRSEGADRLHRLDEAITAWRSAALVRTRAQRPEQWAHMQNEVGYDLILIGEGEMIPPGLREVPILRDALDVQPQLKAVRSAASRQTVLPRLARRRCSQEDRAMLLEARQLCESAIAGETAAGNDGAVKETQGNLARIEDALKMLP